MVFFAFDGTVKTLLSSSVEDYVYDDFDTTKGQQVCAGINNLFSEVVWWYPTSRFRLIITDMLFIIMVSPIHQHLWINMVYRS